MLIPSQVKIGGITYKVEVANTWPERDGVGPEADHGYCSNERDTLYIGSNLSPKAKEITLIHEALHAMNTTIDHEFLDSLAEQLYQFLSDNDMLK